MKARQVGLLALQAGAGAAAVGLAAGLASAIFLLLLEQVTAFREAHPYLVYTLPVAGLGIGLAHERWGKPIQGGNDLVLETVHAELAQIPLRMAPMVLVGTLLTHLFGGSAGREGTAVQMGASLADAIAHRLGVGKEVRRRLVMAGMAGGFGAVFGTPFAGAAFGMEVTAARPGRLRLEALLPAVVAAFVGDQVTRGLGVVHTPYPLIAHVGITPALLGKLVLLAVAMALATVTFVELTRWLKLVLKARAPRLPVRMFVGGLAVVALWQLVGTTDYLGLGVPMIVRAFGDPSLPAFAFAAKLVFTAVTLAAGFLGGEVTPLFFVGATLGSVLARWLGLPPELGAGVGLAAVFGSAANTPVALSIMAVELLGPAVLPHVAVVTVLAYLLTGQRGIYAAQLAYLRKPGPGDVQVVAARKFRT